MKRIYSIIHAVLLLVFLAANAHAGDFAERRIIGFSEDGKYFAFEQFGIQDGSGFPYSEIFVIDTETDDWAGGSPFRTRIEDEQADLQTARTETAEKAQPALLDLGLGHQGRLLASNPPTEAGSNPYDIVFRKYAAFGPFMELHLREIPMDPGLCGEFGILVNGFSLSFKADETQEPVTVHEDTSIPASRGCPLNYGISDVIVYEKPQDRQRMIVLVNIFSHGFEGPDRRFIAIPVMLN
ncbi:MAG: DUF2259 domain-containing protein [Fimbriimonadaceae bacterium]|nr:DUF2259 domain-containing protein [Alphaproteobacteria bacterium]